MKILWILLLTVLFGCVGVIEDGSKPVNKTIKTETNKLKFSGIESGEGISHSKVQLNFKPATGAERITYLAYVNGNYAISVGSLSWSEAEPDSKGYLHITVPNLTLGTSYSFSVRAYDEDLQEEDSNTKKLLVSTLSYQVPNFGGVTKLENLAGSAGKTSLKVFWNKATPSSVPTDIFGANPYAISTYVVYVGESEDTLSLYTSVGATSNDPEEIAATIDGLTPGKNYYIRVRALDSNSPANEDANKVVLSKTTMTDGPIVFSGIESIAIPSNASGLTSATIT